MTTGFGRDFDDDDEMEFVDLTFEEKLEESIDALYLSGRILTVLRRANIRKVSELLKLNDNQLLGIDGIGPWSLEKVTKELREKGLFPDRRTDFSIKVRLHISALIEEVMYLDRIDPPVRDQVLIGLGRLQDQLLALETQEESSLTEQVAMLDACLKAIGRDAPIWVKDRIRAFFSDQAFSASMGTVLGVGITKALG